MTDNALRVVCLDLEGVLFPEVWIALADKTGIAELRLTTRDIADYNDLMRNRISVLDSAGITFSYVTELIGTLQPLPGAVAFLDRLRRRRQVIIVSDTFYQFLPPITGKLGYPTIFCNTLLIENDRIVDFRLRQQNGKLRVVRALQELGFTVAAAGDSHNDLEMIYAADYGALFRAPDPIRAAHTALPAYTTYEELDAWERGLPQ